MMGLFLWCLMFELLRRHTGQCIAYGGGFILSLWSGLVQAAEKVLSVQLPEPSAINAFVGVGGLVAIFGRLFFDIYVYFDKRRRRKEEE